MRHYRYVHVIYSSSNEILSLSISRLGVIFMFIFIFPCRIRISRSSYCSCQADYQHYHQQRRPDGLPTAHCDSIHSSVYGVNGCSWAPVSSAMLSAGCSYTLSLHSPRLSIVDRRSSIVDRRSPDIIYNKYSDSSLIILVP
jgi:hypothetical protein